MTVSLSQSKHDGWFETLDKQLLGLGQSEYDK